MAKTLAVVALLSLFPCEPAPALGVGLAVGVTSLEQLPHGGLAHRRVGLSRKRRRRLDDLLVHALAELMVMLHEDALHGQLREVDVHRVTEELASRHHLRDGYVVAVAMLLARLTHGFDEPRHDCLVLNRHRQPCTADGIELRHAELTALRQRLQAAVVDHCFEGFQELSDQDHLFRLGSHLFLDLGTKARTSRPFLFRTRLLRRDDNVLHSAAQISACFVRRLRIAAALGTDLRLLRHGLVQQSVAVVPDVLCDKQNRVVTSGQPLLNVRHDSLSF
mmetsp:Transcript_24145/g.74740  ORF Transcript_24145/g.74740 Transcript_24145/m.74740 type:complete len:277 (+) Transcript_24145:205-1035(+)